MGLRQDVDEWRRSNANSPASHRATHDGADCRRGWEERKAECGKPENAKFGLFGGPDREPGSLWQERRCVENHVARDRLGDARDRVAQLFGRRGDDRSNFDPRIVRDGDARLDEPALVERE